jgi:ribonuclease HII
MINRTTKQLKHYYYKDRVEVGIDEAGRGPLLGRVYVGAVILPQNDTFDYSLMRDSKKLSEKKRLEAYDYIKNNAIESVSFWMSEKEVDDLNIYKATHNAMHNALDKLNIVPDNILVDGNKFYIYARNGDIIPHACIKGGDNEYCSIAAASIIAKVEHDNYIHELCDNHPTLEERYDLRNNKGYGTKKHLEGIEKYGITEWHRKTFGICKGFA